MTRNKSTQKVKIEDFHFCVLNRDVIFPHQTNNKAFVSFLV